MNLNQSTIREPAIPTLEGPAREAKLELERFLPYRLSVLTNRISTAIARVYVRRFGLTVPEWRVMAVLRRFRAVSANSGCDPTAVGKVRGSPEIGRAHVWTPVTQWSPMPASACKKKTKTAVSATNRTA